jgi:hypothetical protein
MKRRSLLAGLLASTVLTSPAHALFIGIAGGNGPGTWQSYGVYNVKDTPFNATGNGVCLPNGVMSSSSSPTHLGVATANFVSSDAGKVICVSGAGSGGAPLVTTISSVTDGQHVVLGASCLTTVSTATVHYGTDDSTAINAAILACYNAGGGIVFFPIGIYIINGAFQNTSTQNTLLSIPYNAPTNPAVSIAFVGVSAPTVSGSINGGNLVGPIQKASVLFTPVNGSGTTPSLICPYNVGSASDMSNINLTISGLYLRSAYLQPNPLIMVNAQWTAYFECDNLTIETDGTDQQIQATAPTGSSIGLYTPATNNAAFTSVKDTWIVGYDIGFVWQEHCTADNLVVFSCRIGLEIIPAFHAMYGGRVEVSFCKYNVHCGGGGPGKAPLFISELDTEHVASGWNTLTNDVLDPGNNIYGKMTYNVILGGTGYDNAAFSKSGGSNFTCTALF